MAEKTCLGFQKLRQFVEDNFKGVSAPFMVGFELTAKCNLNCVHCYAKCDRSHEDFTYEEFCSVFDQLLELGMLEVYLTGGEIFTRPDFEEIYLYAKRKGVLLSLLTNITLLNKRHIDLLREYPAEIVSTTMYGCTEQTYERVTGVPGSYRRFLRAVDMLHEANIPFEIKYVLLDENRHEREQAQAFAARYGLPLRISANIRPMGNEDRSPLERRLTPEEVFALDESIPQRRAFWIEVARQIRSGEKQLFSRRISEGYLYPCHVADQSAFITSDLHMQGCLRAFHRKYDLRRGTVAEGWASLHAEFREKKHSPTFKCASCDVIKFCEHCSANFVRDGQEEAEIDDFYCKIAAMRAKMAFNALDRPEDAVGSRTDGKR